MNLCNFLDDFMKDSEKYLKYYFLEKYLFEEVRKNFKNHNYLTPEEFFAIVIWKRNASKTKILTGIKKNGRTIREITSNLASAVTREQKLNALLFPKIPGIGIALASAILTVCYPDDFTVIDYRALASIKKLGAKISGDPSVNRKSYLEYVNECKRLKGKEFSLRDFDRMLWGKDFYEGENGLKDLAEGLN